MSSKKHKQPFSAEQPRGDKTPKVLADAPLYDNKKAAWRLGKIQLSDPYGWHLLEVWEFSKLREKLGSFEKNTWHELFVIDARNNHRIQSNQLKCDIARQWMKNNFPDQPYLWTLRISQKERIWGILAENAYQVIFWDPLHKIWEVPKK